ncbi:MAG: ABC transporter ATP-binding protein [Anaerolineales bacterium]
MSSVDLQGITKDFPGIRALDNVTFSLKDGEFFVLLGPTGAGKTTTLRIIAGLTKQDAGSLAFDGISMENTIPADRDVAYVFQQYSLYPTMTVFDNLAFPLRSPLRKTPETEIRKKVDETAQKLKITHLLDRKTARLSGGEMQRVSIGRAIVREPRVFLMDEPLSNLDAKLRESLRVELQHLQKTQGNTTLFVTHDQIEALTMADRIAVLNEGRVIQIGTPNDIYDRPATTFVATLVGTPRINLFKASRDNGTVQIENSELHIPSSSSSTSQFLLGIRPEDVKPAAEGQFAGQVVLTEPLGVETILHIQSGGQTLLSLIPGMTDLKLNDNVRFNLAQDRLHYFNLDGERL